MARIVTLCNNAVTDPLGANRISWTVPADGFIEAASCIGSAMILSVIAGDKIDDLLSGSDSTADERLRLYLFTQTAQSNGYFPGLHLEISQGETVFATVSDGTNFPQVQLFFEPKQPLE